MNFDLHTYTSHNIHTIQYPLHNKCLLEKSCLHCLRILIMSWLFKDPVVIMKEIMSWLFKDPINSGLAQFDHAQSNSKKWAKKIKLPQMNLFLEKQLIKFSWTYWPRSFCKIKKKLLRLIQSYEDVPFSGPKWTICHEPNFFVTTHYYYLHLPIGHFHCAKFKKVLTADPELWDVQFLGPNWSISPYKNIFQKTC